MSSKIDRIGEANINNEGCVMKIVEYNNANDIIVEFQDEHKYRLHAQYGCFKNGKCKNPFYPSVCGHGYLGVDKNGNVPKTREFKDGKSVRTQEYAKWNKSCIRFNIHQQGMDRTAKVSFHRFCIMSKHNAQNS